MKTLGPQGLAEARSSALLSADASDEALELVRWNMSMLSVSSHSQAAYMLASGNLMDDATRYSGPVLVMCGAADTVTPEEGSKKIAAAYSNGHYQTLPGVGHASYVEDPTLFNSTVISFVERLNA
jgi:pimeloyl-ACP methyl ester carboxylesterase